MKLHSSPVLAVLASAAALLCGATTLTASARPAVGRTIDVIAVAERFVPTRIPTTRPISALVIDAGYVELGYPTQGEPPPAPKIVASSLSDALITQGFQPATSDLPVSVVLVYHWGSVRPNPFYSGVYNVAGGPSNAKADPTWKYRLSLVAPARLASRAMELLIEGRTNPLPGAYEPAGVSDIVDRARSARYFAVVSAYDAVSVARGAPALLWRTKLSAETTAGGATDVLPSLLSAAGPYLSRHESKPLAVTAALAPAGTSSAFAQPTVIPASDATVLRTLLRYDHDTLFGPQSPELSSEDVGASLHRASPPEST